MALNNNKPALWIVDEDGSECQRSFHEMSRRSAQVANFLRRVGVRRGDRILLVLGNEVALWECMLGAFKVGAVVIPATVLLTEDDLHDRLTRGQVGHVIATSSVVAKFSRLPGSYTRVCVGPTQSGWLAFAESLREPLTFDPGGSTSATDPLLLYFTSGTTSKPKVVQHTHQSYPVGHLSTMYWLGLLPGDLHLNVSSPGWAKHAWSSFFAPWNAPACIFIYNIQRFSAASLLRMIASHGVTTLCAPPTVWRLIIQEDLSALQNHIKLREVTSAGEPLNPEVIAQVHEAWGLTLRDGFGQTETTALIGNAPGQPVKPGSMGRVLPGHHVTLINSDGRERAEGEICVKLKPVGLMTHYLDDAARTTAALRDGYYHTGDIATRDEDGYVTFVGRVDDVFKSSDYRISPFELESITPRARSRLRGRGGAES
jgi:acetyl-CoA synthetase